MDNIQLDNIIDPLTIPVHLKEKMKTMRPVLLNQYKRKYFISANKILRLTLDYDIKYGRIDLSKSYFMASDRNLIIEFKYNDSHEICINDAISLFPFRLSKSSKYLTGIQKTYSLPYNITDF